ncbi:MAG: hypothetical protein RL677_778 [Actinomycetota bacterium]
MSKELDELVSRSQKLGSDQSLVVYGGGNTSSKGEILDHLNRKRKVLWVKGSGADMSNAVAKDYPGLYLEELDALKQFDALTDEEMTDLVGRALVDPTSRRPSIETLLHAFLPFKHIDHVHADVICALTNHKNGEKAVREALGEGFAYVDWIRPGFELSKQVSFLKDAEGVVLAHHGLIVWDEDTDKCEEKTYLAVEKAQKYLDSLTERPESLFIHNDISDDDFRDLMLQLRGRLNKSGKKILTLDTRLKEISERKDLAEIVKAGVSSADHMLRIKPYSAIVEYEPVKAIEEFSKHYQDYFEENKSLLPAGYSMHDPDPKVLLVRSKGAVLASQSRAENQMLADISFHTHKTHAMAKDAFKNVEGLPSSEIFKFDYWPMELFKLQSKPKPKCFAGSIFIVTGAGGGIGRGIAIDLANHGAALVLADADEAGLAQTLSEVSTKDVVTIAGDQTDPAVVEKTVLAAIDNFGGLDGVVFSAGIGVTDKLEDLTLEKWNKGLSVNLTSAFLLTKAAMKVMRKQNSGGALVYIASKNAFAPGAGFGGYSVSKAGMLQLMRIAALEGGEANIRANAINPDAIFENSKLWEGGIREQRASAHGVRPEELEDFYATRNLLGQKISAQDVANTVNFLLGEKSLKTTGAVLAVDGGVAAGFPR